MSGRLQLLLVIPLAVALGAVAVIYYFVRKRQRSLRTKSAPIPRSSTRRDREARGSSGRRGKTPLLKSGSRDEVAGMSGERVRQGAATTDQHESSSLDDVPRMAPSLHELGNETGEAPGIGTAEEREIRDDQSAVGVHDEQAHSPATTTPATPGGKELPTEHPDEDDMPGLRARRGSVPERPVETLASNEREREVRGRTAPEDAAAPAEQAGIVQEHDVSRDEERRAAEPFPHASADREADVGRPPQRVKASTCGPQETGHTPEQETDEGTADEARGAGGVVAGAGTISDSDAEHPEPRTYIEEPGSEDESDEVDQEDPASIPQRPEMERSRKKKPRKYKGLVRATPPPGDGGPQPTTPGGEEPLPRERSLPIEVRLRFDRGGFCNVSLIAKRSSGLPENLTAIANGGEVNLRAMQDEWYQDVTPHDLPGVLLNGTVWAQEGVDGQCTWSLSGRELYVLADRSDISGYVSQPCLDLGRDHVVLCSESLKSRVEEAIRETGARPATVLDESLGAPPGWVVLGGVVPNSPVAPKSGTDILNMLRPLPKIEISLERGIRLKYTNWLDGHPPSIRVYGDSEHASEVRIDGQVAECGADGAYRAWGWDSVGSHTVWCSGTSRSYSIVPYEASWEMCDAYGFPIAVGATQKLAICGPIVRAVTDEPWGSVESFSVPETNPVLLGPEPGQLVMAARVPSLRGVPRIASPGFRPIWALPSDPLHCDKKTIRILLVGGNDAAAAAKEPGGGQGRGSDDDVVRWYRLILNASRKGMLTDPDTQSVQALWLSYKRVARRMWKSRQ